MKGWIMRRQDGDEFEVLVEAEAGGDRGPYCVLRSLKTQEDLTADMSDLQNPSLWTRVR